VITRRALFRLDFDRPPRPDDALMRVHRTAMACRVEVALAQQDAGALAVARSALDEAGRIESLLTLFRDTSELSRVNREGADGASGVDADVYALLRRCDELHALTGGAFDVTSAPLSRCWGFLANQGRVPADDELQAARALVGMPRVKFDDFTRGVRFERSGMQLNLSAIGRGYALDRMAGVLRASGVRHALVSGGSGGVVAMGGRDGGWLVDIRSPRVARSPIVRVRLRDAALGTSGPGEQFVIADGTRNSRAIDPRSGMPATGVLSVSTVAADAASADALSAAFSVGGCALAEEYCAAHRNTVAIVTLDDEGQRTVVFGEREGTELSWPGRLNDANSVE